MDGGFNLLAASFPTTDPHDQWLERLRRGRDDRNSSGEVRHAIGQAIRAAFVTAQEGNGKAAAFIDDHDGGIRGFVLWQPLQVANGNACGHDKDPFPMICVTHRKRRSVALAVVLQTAEFASEAAFKMSAERFRSGPQDPDSQ